MPNWKKVIVSGSNASLNSLTVSNGITGSLFGTASYALNSDLLDGLNSTVFATTGSNQFNGNQIITGSLTLSGEIKSTGSLILQPDINDVRYLQIYNTSPTDTHITASGGQIFLGNDKTYVKVDNYGTVDRIDIVADNGVNISGSLQLTGSLDVTSGITGSLQGTASFATNALIATSSSYAATSSFASAFTVAGTLTAQTLNVQTVSSSVVYSSGSNVFGNQQSNTQVFTGSVNITGSLNVNGGEIFAGRIDNGSEGGQVSFGRALDNANGWYIDVYGDTSTPSLRFVDVSTSAVRMTISGSGAITMGQSLAVGPINPSAVAGRIDASNDVVAFSTSDKRLKENIQPIENALDKLDKIGGYTFDWNDQVEIHGYKGHDIGVIAQEIEEILPEIVTTRDNGYKAVKYEKIVPFLIQCIKELKDEIRDLKSQK
jgi:cytoskeletal protein CcmA (bactofilin family)